MAYAFVFNSTSSATSSSNLRTLIYLVLNLELVLVSLTFDYITVRSSLAFNIDIFQSVLINQSPQTFKSFYVNITELLCSAFWMPFTQ